MQSHLGWAAYRTFPSTAHTRAAPRASGLAGAKPEAAGALSCHAEGHLSDRKISFSQEEEMHALIKKYKLKSLYVA